MRNIDTTVTFNGESRLVEFSGSFQMLYQQVARVFGIENFVLKYHDEDGDLITMTTDTELQHAYFSVIPLRVEVHLTSAPLAPSAPVFGVQQSFAPLAPSLEQQPILAPQVSAPVLYPSTVQQYAVPAPGFQQPFSQQPVYGQQQFSPVMQVPPVHTQQPLLQQPLYPVLQVPPVLPQQPVVATSEPHQCRCCKRGCDNGKRANKEEWLQKKASRKAEKEQRKAEKKQEKSESKAAKLEVRMSDLSITPPVATSEVNVVVPRTTAVFPPAPLAVYSKTPAGIFYSQEDPRPQGFEIPPNFVGVVQPVPYYYSIEYMDPSKRVLLPGDRFVQRWRVRNEGTYSWPTGMMLVYDPCKKHGAAFFGGRNFVTIDHALGPKQEVVLTFSLVVPALPGRYVGRWRMCTPDLWKFGDKLKVVVKAPTPENAEKAIQKAIKKTNLSWEERKALKAAKRMAKAEAKQRYRETKVKVKEASADDKGERRRAKAEAKAGLRDAKKQAKMAHKEAKMARKEAMVIACNSEMAPFKAAWQSDKINSR